MDTSPSSRRPRRPGPELAEGPGPSRSKGADPVFPPPPPSASLLTSLPSALSPSSTKHIALESEHIRPKPEHIGPDRVNTCNGPPTARVPPSGLSFLTSLRCVRSLDIPSARSQTRAASPPPRLPLRSLRDLYLKLPDSPHTSWHGVLSQCTITGVAPVPVEIPRARVAPLPFAGGPSLASALVGLGPDPPGLPVEPRATRSTPVHPPPGLPARSDQSGRRPRLYSPPARHFAGQCPLPRPRSASPTAPTALQLPWSALRTPCPQVRDTSPTKLAESYRSPARTP